MYERLDRAALALVGVLAALSIAQPAYAEGEPCLNDTDCPGSACGGEVCNWSKLAANPSGDKTFYCQPAGLAPPGADGWCTTDANCKCRAQGAKCISVYCSFTQAESTDPTPSVGGSAAQGGSTRGGNPATAGEASSAGTATELPPSEGDEAAAPLRVSRACNVGPAPANRDVTTLALALLGVASAVARRRRDRPRT
jgi:MYXO-CTERM domain-containing protein